MQKKFVFRQMSSYIIIYSENSIHLSKHPCNIYDVISALSKGTKIYLLCHFSILLFGDLLVVCSNVDVK